MPAETLTLRAPVPLTRSRSVRRVSPPRCPVLQTAGVATFSTVEFATTGSCVLDGDRHHARYRRRDGDGLRSEHPRRALIVTSKSGYLDAPLTLVATGGSGTGALTFSVTNGTATGCLVTSGVAQRDQGGNMHRDRLQGRRRAVREWRLRRDDGDDLGCAPCREAGGNGSQGSQGDGDRLLDTTSRVAPRSRATCRDSAPS